MNDANKKSEAELNQLCQAFLFNLQFIIAALTLPHSSEGVAEGPRTVCGSASIEFQRHLLIVLVQSTPTRAQLDAVPIGIEERLWI